jgi:hypothetical protein
MNMQLKDKIKQLLAKEPYQHDVDQLWADIEQQLPSKPKRRRNFFLLFLTAIAILSFYDLSNEPTYLHRLINNVNQAQQKPAAVVTNEKTISTNEDVSLSNTKTIASKTNAQAEIEQPKKYSKYTPKAIQTVTKSPSSIDNISIGKPAYPLILNLDPTAELQKQSNAQSLQVLPTSARIHAKNSDFDATADVTISDDKVEIKTSIDTKGTIPFSNLFVPHLSPLVVYKREIELQQNLQIKRGQLTKALWSGSIVSLAFMPDRVLAGNQEFTQVKNETERSNLSWSTSALLGRKLKNWQLSSGIQLDMINETITFKNLVVRDQLISTDSARYYLVGNQVVFVPGEINKRIIKGKRYQVPNSIKRWSIPMWIGYNVDVSPKLSIQPSAGLTYTFAQQFTGATFNFDNEFIYRDKAQFSKLYKSGNLWSYAVGAQINYNLSRRLQLETHVRYASDLTNSYRTPDYTLRYKYLGGGLGLKVQI